MDIKRLATSLCKKHETHDPFKIVSSIGYQTIFVPLSGVRGFYQYIERCHIIYIDSSLDENRARFVCAHELGHCLLHKGMNRIFMDSSTHMVASRYEIEADRFASDLIFDDLELEPLLDCPLSTVADFLGISYELAEYRMGSVNPRFY